MDDDEIRHEMQAEIDQLQAALRRECDLTVDLRAEVERLTAALDIARTALLNIERKSEEARASLTRAHEQPAP